MSLRPGDHKPNQFQPGEQQKWIDDSICARHGSRRQLNFSFPPHVKVDAIFSLQKKKQLKKTIKNEMKSRNDPNKTSTEQSAIPQQEIQVSGSIINDPPVHYQIRAHWVNFY